VIIPAKTKTTQEILDAFKTRICANFNIPEALRSDRESGIANSADFRTFAAENQIKLLLTAGRSSFSNGIVESRVNLIKTYLRNLILMTANKNWVELSYLIQLVINTTPSHYRHSPEEIIFGSVGSNDPRNLIDYKQSEVDPDKYAQLISEKLEKVHSRMAAIRDAHKERVRDQQNKGRIVKNFHIGQIVWLKNEIIRKHGALILRNHGPATILKIYKGAKTCKVRNLVTQMVSKVHFSHIFPTADECSALPHNWDANIRDLTSSN
jgi:ribosomal protein L14